MHRLLSCSALSLAIVLRPVLPTTILRKAGAVAAIVGAMLSLAAASAAGAEVVQLNHDGQRPSVAISPVDDAAYVTWLNPGAGDPFYCKLGKDETCDTLIRLRGTAFNLSVDSPFIFAPQLPGAPVYVVQSRSEGTDTLYGWAPKNSLSPFEIGKGAITRDAAMGREGLNGNPLLPTVHGIGDDAENPSRGWVQKGFPLGGTPADALADGLSLDRGHLANTSIATLRDAKTGADQRPVAVFDNNAEIFYAVGKHPGDGGPPTAFRHWNTAVEWNAERKLVNGGSAVLAKSPAYSAGSAGAFFARMVYADDEGRPTVATFGVNGLLGKPKVLGEYATGAFGITGDGIEHAIAMGRDRRTYVVWVANDFFGPDSLMLSVLSESNFGNSYSPPKVEIARGENIRNIAMAVGKNRGVVTWSKEFIGEQSSPVYATTLATTIPKIPTADSGAARAAARKSPYASAPAVKANAAVGKAGFATVLARNGCVTRGRAYKVRVLVGGPRGTKKPKVSRVAVTLSGKTRIDRRGPFSATLSTRKLRRGRTAKVGVRLLNGRKTVKRLRYRLRACA